MTRQHMAALHYYANLFTEVVWRRCVSESFRNKNPFEIFKVLPKIHRISERHNAKSKQLCSRNENLFKHQKIELLLNFSSNMKNTYDNHSILKWIEYYISLHKLPYNIMCNVCIDSILLQIFNCKTEVDMWILYRY